MGSRIPEDARCAMRARLAPGWRGKEGPGEARMELVWRIEPHADSLRRYSGQLPGALRAFRPGGTRRIVILRDDLTAWAFSDEHLVARSSGARLRPTTGAPAAIPRRTVREHSRHDATAGSIERLREIERSA
jgi:hypothetical protein